MTTLAADKARAWEGQPLHIEVSALPVIASDVIYRGAAVGVVDASDHARPLVAGDPFVGFAYGRVHHFVSATAINIDVVRSGYVQLPVTGAAITDVGAPVYASDDDTFQLSPVGGSFIGIVHRFVSAGIVVVQFDVDEMQDPFVDSSAGSSLGFSTVSSLSSAKGLHQGTLGAVPTDTSVARVQPETQDVRMRMDGTNPTASVGTRLYAGSIYEFTGDEIAAVRFIEVTASATLNVEFFD